MFTILEKYLFKKGIEKPEDLLPEERKTFDDWQKILSKEQLTIDDIKQFCESQVKLIETRWQDLTIENSKKSELIPYHTVYRILLNILESPKSMRENLENQLNQLINS